MERLPFPEAVGKSPFSYDRLTRDRVSVRPSESASQELLFDIPETSVFLEGKESLAWKRKYASVTDASGASWRIFVGYGTPDGMDRILIGAKRAPFSASFLSGHATILPFVRARFSGCEATADVYDPKGIAALEGSSSYRWAIFARPDDLLAQLGEMTRGKRFSSADQASAAWEAYANQAFEQADRHARLPAWAYRAQDGEWPVDACLSFPSGDVESVRFLKYRHLMALAPDAPVAGSLYRRASVGSEQERVHQRFQERLRAYRRRFLVPEPTRPLLEEPEQPFLPLVGGGLQAVLPPVRPESGWRVPRRTVTIPSQRPNGAREWARQPEGIRSLSAIDAENWPSLLRVAEGQHFKDVPGLRNKAREHRRQARLKARQEARARLVAGECLDLKVFQEITRVDLSFGHRLLIEGRTADGRTIYAVDSPNYGVGLYLFAAADREAAVAWAAGRSSLQEARRQAFRFIPHTDGWEARARIALQEFDGGTIEEEG